MATSEDLVRSLNTSNVAVPPGATLAFLLTALQCQNSTVIKYFSGGTLEIIGVSTGVTLTAAQLATASGTGYLMGSSEVLNINGPVRCYLSSTGATTVVMIIKGINQ